MHSATYHFERPDSRAAIRLWYQTPLGQKLQQMESGYLSGALNLRYSDRALQIGSLGWEDRFLDRDLLPRFHLLDEHPGVACRTSRVVAATVALPIDSESMDLVIVPHGLEFEAEPQKLLGEVERVLKPEGRLILTIFHPWSVFGLLRYLPGRRRCAPWCGRFIAPGALFKWLTACDLQGTLEAHFRYPAARRGSTGRGAIRRGFPLLCIAYAVKAIKRRVSIVRMRPSWASRLPGTRGKLAQPGTLAKADGT